MVLSAAFAVAHTEDGDFVVDNLIADYVGIDYGGFPQVMADGSASVGECSQRVSRFSETTAQRSGGVAVEFRDVTINAIKILQRRFGPDNY